jgi:GNAT superfamily N-acetyltransferase
VRESPHLLTSLADHPESRDEIRLLTQESWPEFMLHSDDLDWSMVLGDFSDCQLILRERSGELLGVGQALPLTWDGTVADLPADFGGVLTRAAAGRRAGVRPSALAALAVLVSREKRQRGVSEALLGALKALARERGLGHLIVPVRPTSKSRYPLTPMERYVRWRRADGAPFDPWMRLHWRLGAEQRTVIPRSLEVRGTVAQWELWTGLSFPESGQYLVEGALNPIAIDWEGDAGLYVEPNVWMTYRVDSAAGDSPAPRVLS